MLRRTLPGLLVLALAALATGAVNTATNDWAQWRGPRRDNLSPDTGLLQSWPKDGPPLLWEAKGAGRGYATVAVSGGRLYTLGDGPSTAPDKDEYALCFDDNGGKPLWQTKLGPAWDKGSATWQSSRSTPTVDGDRVYYLTAHGTLAGLESATGKEVWRKSMQKDFGGVKGDGWGYSESVLIDGDRLICTPGGGQATMVALDKKTGSLVWKAAAANNKGAGHASVVIAEVGGTRVYVQSTAGGALGVRAKDGKVLWTYPNIRATAVIPTPIVRGDLVFVTAGYGCGGALLRQVPEAGSDGVKIEEVYAPKKELQNKHGGVVLVGDYLYGDSDASASPFCAELMTGKVLWKGRGSGRGSTAVTYADGMLYLHFSDGKMAIARASPEKYEETGSFKVPHTGDRPSWSIPVVTGHKLYLREGDYLFCYDLRQK